MTKPHPPNSILIIHTDGGSRGNPGPASTGVVVFSSDQSVLHEFGRYLGVATNNVAEYSAVLDAVNWVVQNNFILSTLDFKLDSQLVVEQLLGHWKINDPTLRLLHSQITSLISTHHLLVKFTYVPRAQNHCADAMVNQILDARTNRLTV